MSQNFQSTRQQLNVGIYICSHCRCTSFTFDMVKIISTSNKKTHKKILSKAPCKRTQHCWPTTPNIVGCYMLVHVVAQSLKPVRFFSQQLPTFLLFRDRRSVAQQCWIRLHSSPNNGSHARSLRMDYKDLWVVFFPRCTAGPNLLGVVASVCTPLPIRTQQLPTLLRQQCWELLRPFARSLRENK